MRLPPCTASTPRHCVFLLFKASNEPVSCFRGPQVHGLGCPAQQNAAPVQNPASATRPPGMGHPRAWKWPSTACMLRYASPRRTPGVPGVRHGPCSSATCKGAWNWLFDRMHAEVHQPSPPREGTGVRGCGGTGVRGTGGTPGPLLESHMQGCLEMAFDRMHAEVRQPGPCSRVACPCM